MSLIRMKDIHLRFEARQVLREVNFRLLPLERVGLVGSNGSGKTTILKLILAQLAPSEGTVDVTPGTRVSYFSQFSELDEQDSVQAVLEGVFAEVRGMEHELEAIAHRFNEAALTDTVLEQLLARQAHLLEQMEHADGWHYQRQIDTVLNKLGFRQEDRERPLSELSGGWRNRAALAKIMLEQPEVLLLDEPTNFLDINGVEWLEGWLRQFRGAAIVVSHDRHFLDQVVTRVVEIENYHTHDYSGGYTEYIRERRTRLKSLERQFQFEEELLVYEAEAMAERREEAKNPGAALQRRLSQVKKRSTPRLVDNIVTDIYHNLRVPTKMLEVEELGKGYDAQRPLFRQVSCIVRKGERLAILGPNGCGKSTLLRVLTLELAPDAGTVRWDPGADFADFNRMLAELDLKDCISHAANVTKLAYAAPKKVTNRFLTLLRFNELEMQQPMGTLSGGQRARAALALCALSGAQTLVLDEPTNHLDMSSIQVLERTLAHFPGAVIFVSHDRNFIDNVATRLLLFDAQGQVREVAGNWTIWQASQNIKPLS